MLNKVYSMWIGQDLSLLHIRCIKSWLKFGYEFHLFVYRDHPELPSDVIVHDGNDILPPQDNYKYTTNIEYRQWALYGNLFRYKYLYEYGGTWVDLDTACLKPLLPVEHIISSAPYSKPPYWISNFVIVRTVPKAKLFEDCYNSALDKIKEVERPFGLLGPRFFREQLKKHGLYSLRYISYPKMYHPLGTWLTPAIYEPYAISFIPQSYTIHFSNISTHKYCIDVNKKHHPACFYEQIWSHLNIC